MLFCNILYGCSLRRLHPFVCIDIVSIQNELEESMGRKNTIAMQRIWNLCKYNSMDINELKTKTELLLSLYRDICWSVCKRSKECETEAVTFCSNDVDLGLIYLFEFSPTPTKKEFTEKVYSMYHTRYLISKMDDALLRLKEYPKNGELYYRIVKLCYMDKEMLSQDEIICRLPEMDRSTYYDRKKEAILLFGICLWC